MTYTGETKRAYQREWLRKRRLAWIAEHGPCVTCGSFDDLELDHVDASTKLMRPSLLWSLSPTNPKRVAELAKCVVKCTKCHKLKTKVSKEHARHESHGSAKLTMELANEIRYQYTLAGSTIRGLARQYDVDRNTLRSLLRNETWI